MKSRKEDQSFVKLITGIVNLSPAAKSALVAASAFASAIMYYKSEK